jgi:hypothetical protein
VAGWAEVAGVVEMGGAPALSLVLALALAAALELGVEEPGIVWALTTAKPPTPASALNATPAVRRFSLRRAASRALVLAWIVFSLGISKACCPPLNLTLMEP